MEKPVEKIKATISIWNRLMDCLEEEGIHITVEVLTSRGEELVATHPRIVYKKSYMELV